MKYIHWQLNIDGDDVAWLHLDQHNSHTNVLSEAVLGELSAQISDLKNAQPKAVILCSDKPSGFILGADIESFTQLESTATVEALISKAQLILNRFEALPMPTLALIHGFCLGGGLELALACRYRLALDDDKTKLGFPEVRLGLFPGFGGSLRSTRLLGAPTAMNLMLTGRNVSARAAQKMGLVDCIAPQRLFRASAKAYVLSAAKPQQPSALKRLSNVAWVRPFLAMMMRKQVRKKAHPAHYPAPYALIEHWQAHAGSAAKMLSGEARAVSQLVTGSVAQNLIRVFFLMEKLKHQGRAADCQAQRVHVIGAGVMGGDIAAWCALQGLSVSVQDQNAACLKPMMQRAQALFKKKLKRPNVIQQAMDRIIPDVSGHGLQSADVIIEAISENIEAKHALYQHIEPLIKTDALLVSNTSSITLAVLSRVLKRPERLIGLHFFNPVAMMQLVEVVSTADSDPAMLTRACDFTRRIDRLPLPVNSGPGFLVNRVLMPYLMEAVTLLGEGVSAVCIDATAKQFGMPIGPIELADTVGLDVCLQVAQILSDTQDTQIPEPLQQLVAQGQLGRKTGQGFYRYHKGQQIRPKVSDHPTPELEQRLIMRLVNEAAHCLQDKVVTDADLLDAGIIFGTGFAPFRGGPIHYQHSLSKP